LHFGGFGSGNSSFFSEIQFEFIIGGGGGSGSGGGDSRNI
jgi:hypothetical protein